MTSIIWTSMGVTLLLILAIGAVIQHIKDRKKYKKTKVEEWNKTVDMISVEQPANVKTPDISEPVTSFIKCFKENPKRFKLSCTDSPNWWTLKDSLTKKEWVFATSKGAGLSSWYHLHIQGRGYDWLTDSESDALVAAMYPYFVTERRERLHAIQRHRLTRIYKEKE